jgi:hypothetical protein
LGSDGSKLNQIKFNDSHSITWTNGATLTVTGWTGTLGNAGTVGRLFVLPTGTTNVGLSPSQLAQISFTGYANTSAMLTTGGEVIPITMPTLTAATGATVDAPFDITFGEQATWRDAITGITVNGTTLDPSAYNTSVAGKITFTPANSTLLQTAGTKTIVISASGIKAGAITTTFVDLTVSQTIGAALPTGINSTIDNQFGFIYKNSNNQIVVNIENGLSTNNSVSVYNTGGKKIISERLKKNTTILDKKLDSGVYLVIITNKFKTSRKKIIVN